LVSLYLVAEQVNGARLPDPSFPTPFPPSNLRKVKGQQHQTSQVQLNCKLTTKTESCLL